MSWLQVVFVGQHQLLDPAADSIMVWRFEGETWTPPAEGEPEPVIDQAEALLAAASDDTVSVGTNVADAVERIIQLTLGKILNEKQGAMASLPLETQHAIAEKIARAREMFETELTALAEAKMSQDGNLKVISDADIMEVLAKVGPQLNFGH